MIEFTLYVRHGCHLCEDMEQQLRALQDQVTFAFTQQDVDADPRLIQAYGHLIPVLIYGDETLCHYFLDQAAVLQAIGKQPHT